MKYWKSSLTISAKLVGAWAGSQLWIPKGRTIWIADAHRDDGRRYVVRAEEKLTAFVGLESGDSIRRNAQRTAERVI